MSRAFITTTFTVGALFAATACAKGDASTGPDPADHVLVKVDAKPIPFVIDDGPFYTKASVADSGTRRGDAVRLVR